MDSTALRSAFLEYFSRHDHTVVPSAPLVPDDPTLLFVNAGMVPFKDTFLGAQTRPYRRAASCQKCLRVTGKHNDLETVGPSPRHHTFFEMLGNFSFGDYFKPEAITRAWEFLTESVRVDPSRLMVTVHDSDDEALAHWIDGVGVPAARILRMGDATNFWMMADVGPCGTTSELHYDFGTAACTCRHPECSVALDNGCARWLEVWNLVFMQYDQKPDGRRVALPRTGVDTGMGLERLTSVVADAPTNYHTDLFALVMDTVQSLAGHNDRQRAEHVIGYRVLADHGRAMTFAVADGVLPGNEGRAYVLRLIMRRAMRFGRNVGLTGPFLGNVAESVITTMAPVYPELRDRASWIADVTADEEERFARTLESGLGVLDDVIGRVKESGGHELPGAEVFRLYDTYGFPPDLTRIVAEEQSLAIDRAGFDDAMNAQRDRARAGGRFSADEVAEILRGLNLPATEFVGYDELAASARVVAILVDGSAVDHATPDDTAFVVLDRSPFYGESGGQVGDSGALVGEAGRAEVTDTRRPATGLTVHVAAVLEGILRVGDSVEATIDADRRLDIMRNHTATHLLHAALREVVGDHAQQRGSLVAPDRLRFDFANLKALTTDQVRAIESRVNADVRRNATVSWQSMPMADARELGATMLFGEKYGDTVRVVSVENTSRELCGGTHLSSTGQIGSFLVVSESGIGSGLRRIEAVTGRGADAFVRDRLDVLDQVARQVGATDPARTPERVAELETRLHDLEREASQWRERAAADQAQELAAATVTFHGVSVIAARVDASSADDLRTQVDAVRSRLPSGVIFLGTVVDGSPRLVASISQDLVSRGLRAPELVKAAARHIGGGGGGRPTLAEAGGSDADGISAAIDSVGTFVEEFAQGNP